MTNKYSCYVLADPNKCTGCKACELACFAEHNKSNNGVGYTVGTVTIPVTPKLYLTKTKAYCMPIQCRHCEDAPCLNACQKHAIYRENSQVIVDQEKCIGCKDCVLACPFGAIAILPIGEKGIGRFGAHKLGDLIEMTTKSANAKEVYVQIDWTQFAEHRYLTDVPIKIIERDHPKHFLNGKTGTKIVIKGFRKAWERGMARSVIRAITSITSPFESMDSFKPLIQIIDKPEWFEDIMTWDKVCDYSLFQFDATISGNSISDFSYKFTPWNTMTKLHERTLGMSDAIVENNLLISDDEDWKCWMISPAPNGTLGLQSKRHIASISVGEEEYSFYSCKDSKEDWGNHVKFTPERFLETMRQIV